MPLHDYRCSRGHVTERFYSGSDASIEAIICPDCPEGSIVATKVFLRAPMGFVQKDICYDSPVDGRPITTKQARIEDLRRNGCVEWDAGMMEEIQRRKEESFNSLEKRVEQTFDAEVAKLPTRKKELLQQELASGSSVEVARGTPNLN